MKLIHILFSLIIFTMTPMSILGQQSEKSSYTNNSDKNNLSIEITVIDNRIKVQNAPIGSKLEIYSVVGIKIKEIDLKESSGEYPVNIAKGYYIIRIDDTVRKVAIR